MCIMDTSIARSEKVKIFSEEGALMGATIFKNYNDLITGGDSSFRKDGLSIAQAGVENGIPYENTKKLIKADETGFFVGEKRYEYNHIGKIYVAGVGKGAYPIAKAIDEAIGDKIADGVIVVKEGETRTLPHIRTFQSSHPIPDERSIEGAKMIFQVLSKAGEGDIVFAPVTGGSSALVNLPQGDITMDDLKTVNRQLLHSGAPIRDINAVRKHICGIKGGRIVQKAHPAEVITFTLDTNPRDLVWPDLCLPDPTTFKDAYDVLKDYGIWDDIPESVRKHILNGLEGNVSETLKSLDGIKHTLYSVADPFSMCQAAADKAESLGYNAYIIGSELEGEAKDMGIFLGGIANEELRFDRPFKKPCCIISSGECATTITGPCGLGGCNQEVAISFAMTLRYEGQALCISLDSDGTDGPCEIAGGITDDQTVRRAEEMGVDLKHALRTHSTADALTALGDQVVTGHTGTNIRHLRIVLVK